MLRRLRTKNISVGCRGSSQLYRTDILVSQAEMPPKIAKPAEKALDRNHALLFKQLLQNYEQKEYKKGIKTADTVLKKYPNHGETMAMKGLILTNMDKREEGWECVRKGLRNDLKSHICWHVYGLLYRADRNYEESMKCYLNALKYDPDNLVVLRDLAVIQSQLRIYPGLVETRRNLMNRQPDIRGHHTAYAVAYHLDSDYTNAAKVLREYDEKLLVKPKNNAEHSMTTLYYNTIVAESGDLEKALKHLDRTETQILDKLDVLERRAKYNLGIEQYTKAESYYRDLLDINPDCHRYYLGLERSLKYRAENSKVLPEMFDSINATYDELQHRYPKASAPRRRPFEWLHDDVFKNSMNIYLRNLLQKGVPSTFVDIKALYEDEQKAVIVENLVEEYVREYKQLSNSASDTATQHASANGGHEKAPTFYIWSLYFLAQSYDHRRNLARAQEVIDEALSHTPTLVELHLTKARILKHAGSPQIAAEQMNVARELDLQDRFINTKSTKYFLRADQNGEAINTISLFLNTTLGGGAIGDLQEMQSISFILEDGLSYARQSLLGLALKRFASVKKAVDQWYEDEFDFHQYCFRKGTIDAYISSMKWENSIYRHSIYKRAARGAIEALLRIHRHPELKAGPLESGDVSEADKKKEKKRVQRIRARCAKDATKEAEKKDGVDMHRKIDDDPVGDKLLASDTVLDDALAYVIPWLHDAPEDEEALLLSAEIHIEKQDYQLAIGELKKISDRASHRLVYQLKQKYEANGTEKNEQVDALIKQTFSDRSVQDWNKAFLDYATTTAEFLAGLWVASDSGDDDVEALILNRPLDMRTTTLGQARDMLSFLEKSRSKEAADVFWGRIKSVWTLAQRL